MALGMKPLFGKHCTSEGAALGMSGWSANKKLVMHCDDFRIALHPGVMFRDPVFR
jgi:hypothetical protein